MSELSVLISLAKAQAADPLANELASSPAFQCLDALLTQGLLTLSQVDSYKSRYITLHSTVLSSCTLERSLLDRSKKLKAVNEAQTEEYRTSQAATVFLHNTLQQQQQRLTVLTHSLHSLSQERSKINGQFEELQSSRPEHFALMNERADKAKHALDMRMFELDIEAKESAHALEKEKDYLEKEKKANADYLEKKASLLSELEQMKESIQTKQESMQTLESEPERLRIATEKLSKKEGELEKENSILSAQSDELEKQMAEVCKMRRNALANLDNEAANIENYRLFIAKKKSNVDELLAEQSLEEMKKTRNLENYQFLLNRRQEMKSGYFTLQSELNNEIMKETEMLKQKIEKFRRKKETLNSFLGPLREQIDEKIIRKKKLEEDTKFYLEQKECSHQNIEQAIVQILASEDSTSEITTIFQHFNADIAKREAMIVDLRKEEARLMKEIATQQSERNHTLRDYSRLSLELNKLKQEVVMENLRIKEYDKNINDHLRTIEMCGEKYELLKNQKNNLMNVFNTTQQQMTEVKEKSRILSHEYLILTQESLNKDKKMNAKKAEQSMWLKKRDVARNEENRARVAVKVAKANERSQLLEVQGLQESLNNAEQTMNTLRNAYEQAVSARNSVGLNLIDRNDELCLLYQQRDAISSVLAERAVVINNQEEALMVQNRQISEFERRIEVARKQVPSMLEFENLVRRRDELEKECKKVEKQVEELGIKLETPPIEELENDGKKCCIENKVVSRARMLGGSDPEPEQLCLKIEQLEHMQEIKQKALLDRELTLTELLTSNAKIREQAAETRKDSVNKSVHFGKLKQELNSLTRAMMSNVSELSLYQANCLQLSKERDQLITENVRSKERMARGEPPTDDSEHEWQKFRRDKQRQREALLNAKRSQEELELVSSLLHSHTTAEMRPNAYISDYLGVPRPYGTLAPFKPSQLGAQMRHFRPLQPKEIQL